MKRYYIVRGSARNGPFSESEILDLIEQGRLNGDERCVTDDGDDAARIGDLFETVHQSGATAPNETLDQRETADRGHSEFEKEVEDDWAENEKSEDENAEREAVEPGLAATDLSPTHQRRSAAVIARFHPSFLSYIGTLVLGAGAAIGGYYFASHSGWFAFGGVATFSLAVTFVAFDRTCREYIVTEKRIEIISGLIAKSSREVRVDDIRAINVQKKGILGLLGVGDVEFSSAGSDGVDVAFTKIWRPHRVKKLVRRLQDD